VLFYCLATLAFAVASCEACVADSQIRRRPIVTSLRSWMLFFYPIAVPAYLVIARGWRGVLLTAGIWIGLYLIGWLVTNATFHAVYGSW
jgi:hypothetical protein